MSARLSPRAAPLTIRVEVEPVGDQAKFPRGTTVKITGTRGGVYVVRGYNRDGSLVLFGGPAGHGAFRSVMPDRVRKIRRREES